MHSLNMAMILQHNVRATPDKPFIVDGERTMSYAQLELEARCFANAVAGLGLQKGARIALYLPNVFYYPVCHYGSWKSSLTVVPLNTATPPNELAFFLADSESSALVTVSSLLEPALEAYEKSGCCRHLIVAGLDQDKSYPDFISRYETLVASAKNTSDVVPVSPLDPAAILYTSGTTGRPKGAVLCHLNYFYFSYVLARDLWQVSPNDVILMIGSASHIFGQTLLTVTCAASATLRLMSTFSPKAILDTIAQEKVSFLAGVPTIAHVLMQSARQYSFDISSLRTLFVAGAAIPPGMPDEIRSRLDANFITGYGMTEAVPISILTADMTDAPPGSTGKVVPATCVCIVDEKGTDVPVGDSGEILVRGPQVFQGYWKRPEESSSAFEGEWFHTGDVGYMDENGHLFIVDRLRDMIKMSGNTVFPAEVERVLCIHPAVAEAAVVGVPHDDVRGEIVKAFVVLNPACSVTEKELIKHCKTHLVPFKCPRQIEFRDNFVKGSTGKIVRRALLEC